MLDQSLDQNRGASPCGLHRVEKKVCEMYKKTWSHVSIIIWSICNGDQHLVSE